MFKAPDIARFLAGLLILAVIAAIVLWRVGGASHPGKPAAPPPPPPPRGAESCSAAGWGPAVQANAGSLTHLAWAPFGRAESGWEAYAPLVAREVGSRCAPDSAGFASAYAAWEHGQGLAADGIFKPDDFRRMLATLELRRPFVQQSSKGLCPDAPPESALSAAAPGETLWKKPILLRTGALAAYRRMVAAARSQGFAQRGEVLKLISGYRGPAEEASRCADGGCNTVTRAHCSAHRTGLALDLYLDHAPGQDPTATADANRIAMAHSPEYRWLVAHASDFGFLPYPYEPWHWEWTGESP